MKNETKNERTFANNFARNYKKKIILGTSDAWSMRRSSYRPSYLAYYIEVCRISNLLQKSCPKQNSQNVVEKLLISKQTIQI